MMCATNITCDWLIYWMTDFVDNSKPRSTCLVNRTEEKWRHTSLTDCIMYVVSYFKIILQIIIYELLLYHHQKCWIVVTESRDAHYKRKLRCLIPLQVSVMVILTDERREDVVCVWWYNIRQIRTAELRGQWRHLLLLQRPYLYSIVFNASIL